MAAVNVVPPEGIPAAGEGQLRLFVKAGCPFCYKTLAFLGEAGLSDKVFPIWDHPVSREYITAAAGKASFPALETAPGQVMLESQDIIDKFATENNIDVSKLWVSKFYNTTIMPTFMAMVMRLKDVEGGWDEFHAWIKENSKAEQAPEAPEGTATALV